MSDLTSKNETTVISSDAIFILSLAAYKRCWGLRLIRSFLFRDYGRILGGKPGGSGNLHVVRVPRPRKNNLCPGALGYFEHRTFDAFFVSDDVGIFAQVGRQLFFQSACILKHRLELGFSVFFDFGCYIPLLFGWMLLEEMTGSLSQERRRFGLFNSMIWRIQHIFLRLFTITANSFVENSKLER